MRWYDIWACIPLATIGAIVFFLVPLPWRPAILLVNTAFLGFQIYCRRLSLGHWRVWE